MNKGKILTILIIIGFSLNLFAQTKQVSLEEAQNAAISRVAMQTSFPRTVISVTDVALIENDNGNVLLYEVATDKGITVLLSGSRTCLPILGVHENEEGMILNQFDSLPCGLQFLIKWYKSQVNNSFYGTTIDSFNVQKWRSLINGTQSIACRFSGVSPLLKSEWGQSISNDRLATNAYNYLMPSGGGCDHCVAGCVAVAMGQVMYYWKYPVMKKIREIQFDWCNMTDRLNKTAPSYSKNRDAISYLLLECGKSVDMEYGCDGSTASAEDAVDALVYDFNYSDNMDFKRRMWYSDNEWKNMIRSQLDARRPVIYRGQASLFGDGHTFVCDGYNEYDQFHFNWGWRNHNGENTYYTLDYLYPDTNNFEYFHAAIFDIQPDEYQDYCDYTLCLDDFYGFHLLNPHPLYTVTPKTMTKLISASSFTPSSWRTIPSGATAEYVAHKEVVLKPGFTAQYGCNFTARIEPCVSCENRLEQTAETHTDEESPSMRSQRNNHSNATAKDSTIVNGKTGMRLFPNPTNGRLTVLGTNKATEIGVFDTKGKSVFRWFIVSNSDGEIVLDVSNIPSGLYILKIETREGYTYIQRFAKD